jgi:hypothetical protein
MLTMFRTASLAAALAIGSVLAGIASTSPAVAQQPSIEHQIELTAPMVEAFLVTYPRIEALGEEFERQYGYAGADPEDPAGFAMAYARYAEARERMEAILSQHGIGSMEEWARIAYSLMIAYSFAEGGENIGGMDQEMAAAINQIRNDPSIPAEQRDHLIAALEGQLAQIQQMRPSPGNIALATQYAEEIRAVVDHAGEED